MLKGNVLVCTVDVLDLEWFKIEALACPNGNLEFTTPKSFVVLRSSSLERNTRPSANSHPSLLPWRPSDHNTVVLFVKVLNPFCDLVRGSESSDDVKVPNTAGTGHSGLASSTRYVAFNFYSEKRWTSLMTSSVNMFGYRKNRFRIVSSGPRFCRRICGWRSSSLAPLRVPTGLKYRCTNGKIKASASPSIFNRNTALIDLVRQSIGWEKPSISSFLASVDCSASFLRLPFPGGFVLYHHRLLTSRSSTFRRVWHFRKTLLAGLRSPLIIKTGRAWYQLPILLVIVSTTLLDLQLGRKRYL